MPQSDIVNFLGVASEAVSRELIQLEKDDILQVDRRRVQVESICISSDLI